MEKMYEKMDLDNENHNLAVGAGAEEGAASSAPESGPTKATAESMKAGELLHEALIVWEKDRADADKFESLTAQGVTVAPPARDPLIIQMDATKLTPEQFVLKVIKQIRPSQLNDALISLPFSQVCNLIAVVSRLATDVIFT
jgi:U3 small nucleolar RNA-associated protein 12